MLTYCRFGHLQTSRFHFRVLFGGLKLIRREIGIALAVIRGGKIQQIGLHQTIGLQSVIHNCGKQKPEEKQDIFPFQLRELTFSGSFVSQMKKKEKEM